MAKAFEDIGKESVEFITKGYPNSGTFKVACETKTPNGVGLKATATRSFDSKGEKIGAELEPKFDWQQHNIELSGKLATGGDFEGGVTFNDIATKGAKVSFTGFQSDGSGSAAKAVASYKNEQATAKAGVKFPFRDNTHVNWNGEVTVRHENIHAGADVRFDQAVPAANPEGEQPKDRFLYNFKAAYVTSEFQAMAHAEDQVNKEKTTLSKYPVYHLLNFNFLYAVTSAIKFGFGASVERNNARGVELSAGGEYKVDKDTVVKGKFSVVQAAKPDDREFRIGLAAKQNLSERVNVTVGADVNARALLGAPGGASLGATKPHSFGFEVKFQ
jgi:hypothetical protein